MDIEREDSEALEERLERARIGRSLWWNQRQAANWLGEEMSSGMSEAPTGSDIFGRMLGFGRGRKSKSNPD